MGATTGLVVKSETLADGWYRCTLQAQVDSSRDKQLQLVFQLEDTLGVEDADSAVLYKGDGISGVQIKDMRLEARRPNAPLTLFANAAFSAFERLGEMLFKFFFGLFGTPR